MDTEASEAPMKKPARDQDPPVGSPHHQVISAQDSEEGSGSFRNLIKKSGGSVTLQFTEVFFQIGILYVLAHGLGAETFGNYIYAFTLVTFLVLFGRLGLDTSSVRFVSIYLLKHEYALLRGYLKFAERTVLCLSSLLALALILGMLLSSRWISPELMICGLLMSPLIVFMGLLQVRAGILRGFNKVLRSRIPQTLILPGIFFAGSTTALWIYPGSKHALSLIVIVQVVAAAAAALVAGKWISDDLCSKISSSSPQFDRRAWLASGSLLVVLAGMSKLQAQTDILMLGALQGTREAGIYATASRISSLPILILVASNMVISPLCARMLRSDSGIALQRLIRRSGVLVAGLALPMIAGLAIFGKPVLELIGPEFATGNVPLLILLAGRFFFILSGPAGVLLHMSGNESLMAKILGAGMVLNIALNAILIPVYGSCGAAIATATSTILCRAILAYSVWHKLRIPSSIIQPATWKLLR